MPPAATNTQDPDASSYGYQDATLNCSHAYLLPRIKRILASLSWPQEPKRIFELGCGSGGVASELTKLGFDITGVDPAREGIAQANKAFPHLKLFEGSAYDDLAGKYGQFPVLLSLEVVEHVYFPRKYAACAYSLLPPGGVAIISTPYHGYIKNLALAVAGGMDAHFTALWDHGHIKFWSMRTLGALLQEAGFRQITFHRVGRLPIVAKSMIAVAVK